MTTLYKRANGPQSRMLKVISGAVMNTAHAHPEYRIDQKFARGVAKRACGTLTAQWPDVLAANAPSGSEPGDLAARAPSGAHSRARRPSGSSCNPEDKGKASISRGLPPIAKSESAP